MNSHSTSTRSAKIPIFTPTKYICTQVWFGKTPSIIVETKASADVAKGAVQLPTMSVTLVVLVTPAVLAILAASGAMIVVPIVLVARATVPLILVITTIAVLGAVAVINGVGVTLFLLMLMLVDGPSLSILYPSLKVLI